MNAERCFIDTNVFVYAHDPRDPKKRMIARELIFSAYESEEGAVSTQVLAEFFNVYVVKLGFPVVDAIRELHFMSRGAVVEQTLSLVVSATSLFSRHALSFWDAMIVAAAIESQARVLYSEDLQHRAGVEGIRIVNPFVAGAENATE